MVSVCGDPTEEQWGDLLFAWRVCKHVGSNAIVLAKDLQTVGIGAGQTVARRRRAPRASRRRASTATTSTGAALASDAFFPLRRRPAARARRGRDVDHPAGRLEARRRGRRGGRGGGRGDGLHRPPPLPALGSRAVDLDGTEPRLPPLRRARPRAELRRALGRARPRRRACDARAARRARRRARARRATASSMAHPFSAVPTVHRVRAAGRSWYANCAWDAFGVLAALDVNGRVSSTCADCGTPRRDRGALRARPSTTATSCTSTSPPRTGGTTSSSPEAR